MLYFFHVPGNIHPASHNETEVVKPADTPDKNATKLETAASVENKADAKREESTIEAKNDNGIDTGGKDKKEESDTKNDKKKTDQEQPEEVSETDQDTQKEDVDDTKAALNSELDSNPDTVKTETKEDKAAN